MTFEWTEDDLILLRDAGVGLPWELSPTIMFQSFIRQYGTLEEETRLLIEQPDYTPSSRLCSAVAEDMRSDGAKSEEINLMLRRLIRPKIEERLIFGGSL